MKIRVAAASKEHLEDASLIFTVLQRILESFWELLGTSGSLQGASRTCCFLFSKFCRGRTVEVAPLDKLWRVPRSSPRSSRTTLGRRELLGQPLGTPRLRGSPQGLLGGRSSPREVPRHRFWMNCLVSCWAVCPGNLTSSQGATRTPGGFSMRQRAPIEASEWPSSGAIGSSSSSRNSPRGSST